MGRGAETAADADLLARPYQPVTRALGSSTLVFCNIPINVRIYPAATKRFERFRFQSPQGNPVKLRYEDAKTHQPIRFQELRRAVQVGKELLPLSKQEWEILAGEKKNLIEAREAIAQRELSPFSIERNYFLSPQRKHHKAYRLLQKLLQYEKKSLLGKWYLPNGRDRFIMISSSGSALMMSHLYYYSELRTLPLEFTPITIPTPQEVSLAKQLLDRLTTEKVSLNSYQDEWSSRLSSILERRPNLPNLLKLSIQRKQSHARKHRLPQD